jgi:outer membrane protein OmpA-like peptidoglycan-associated protein/tetratricopeptide (TPR) repeat protein
MKIFASICLFFIINAGFAQQYNPSKINKQAYLLYQQASQKADQDDLAESLSLLQQAIKKDSNFLEAYLSLGGMFGKEKKYADAVKQFAKAMTIDSVYAMEYNLSYSVNLAGTGAFEKALDAINVFLRIPDLNESSIKAGTYRKLCYQFAVDYKKAHPDIASVLEPTNLGDSVNTTESEYFPSLTIDNTELIFTRRVRGINEDFYETNKRTGIWRKAKPLNGNINTNFNEGAQSISQDGQWLIFTGCNFPEGYGSCDLYISYLTADGWSAAENLGSKINTEAWESTPSLSPDKKDLYFSSNRAGGYGGSDIYVSHLLASGQWSEPENLGPVINTINDESCPFIHTDNQTLYFTSKGHPGYGGYDLYMTKKAANRTWSKPLNLGYPINTINDEGNLVISSDGGTAYYSSDRSDSRGGLDIYSFEMPQGIRPVKTLWVKGKVYDNKTNKGLPSSVILTDLQTRETISKVQTDESGKYLITLPVGKDYAFNVNRKGYLFFSDNFPLSQKAPDSTYAIDIPLQPLEANASIILKNIFFDNNKFDLKVASQFELDNVVSLLKENPTIKIQIDGHTDNIGKPADNMILSKNRAKAVVDYIASKGIDPKRLSFQGFGEKIPLADNSTEESRAKNRRTALKIVSQ